MTTMIVAEVAHATTAWFVLSAPAKEEKESLRMTSTIND